MTTLAAPCDAANCATRSDCELPVAGARLLDVADIEHRLRGDELQGLQDLLLLGIEAEAPRRLAVAQRRENRLHHLELGLRLLVLAARLLLGGGDPPLDAVEIGKEQLGLDRLGVADRIDRALDMGDVAVLEAAQDMGDRLDLADMGEELVAETLALRGAAHQAGDVDEFELGRHDLRRLAELRQDVEPRIRHGDAPDIGLDRAERVVRRLGRRGRGQRVEQRRFADIGQADNAAVETHFRARVLKVMR